MCGYELHRTAHVKKRPREIPNPRMKLCNIDSGSVRFVLIFFDDEIKVDPTPSLTTMSAGPYWARPLVLSGPSGSGKSTLLKRLLYQHPGKFAFSVSR
jgi:hypothetical protein